MPDTDPLEQLSKTTEWSEQPDPVFAAGLLDHLVDDLAEASPGDAGPFPLEEAGERGDEDADLPRLVQIIGSDSPSPERRADSRSWILRAAAAVLVVLGGLALSNLGDERLPVTTTDDESSPVTTIADDVSSVTTTADEIEATPEPLDDAQQLAADFMTAHAASDGATMRSLLADDAAIINDYGITVPEDYKRRADYEELTNTTISNVACQAISADRVSCQFEFRNDISRHLRPSAFDVEVIVTVRDGLIVGVQGAWPFALEEDLDVFRDWLDRTYPEDVPAIADVSTFEKQFTPEAGAVLADRTPEFVATTPPSIYKLVAEDPRFSTLAIGLERTGVAVRLALCGEDLTTLFAPTNDAFDRYLEASGLDRDSVVSDTALFEALVATELLTLSGTTDEQPAEVATRSGETVTVAGGIEPQVQGIPILADTIDVAACNGAINGIDNIYLPNN